MKILSAMLLTGCGDKGIIEPVKEIQGFSVFPIEEIRIGDSTESVSAELGTPSKQTRSDFMEPNRVEWSELPPFDEQWGYFAGMANQWVFFQDGKVVAAFREESDF